MYLRLASLCAYLKYHFFLLLIWESFLATIWQLLFQVKCWSFWVSVWAWRWASWWRSRWTWPQPRWSQRPRLRTRQEGCFLCQYQKNVQTVSEISANSSVNLFPLIELSWESSLLNIKLPALVSVVTAIQMFLIPQNVTFKPQIF